MLLLRKQSVQRGLSLEDLMSAGRTERLIFVSPELYLRPALPAGDKFRHRHILRAAGTFLLLREITVPHGLSSSLPVPGVSSCLCPIS